MSLGEHEVRPYSLWIRKKCFLVSGFRATRRESRTRVTGDIWQGRPKNLFTAKAQRTQSGESPRTVSAVSNLLIRQVEYWIPAPDRSRGQALAGMTVGGSGNDPVSIPDQVGDGVCGSTLSIRRKWGLCVNFNHVCEHFVLPPLS